jgi:folate-binding protein YgfZ
LERIRSMESAPTEAEARAQQADTDKAWSRFVSRLFDRDPADPSLYHLVVDTTALPIDTSVDVLATVTRRGDDAVLATDPGWGAHLADSLTRFKIRTKVEITVEPAPDVDDTTAESEERARVAAGIPRLGADLDDSVIPQEAFLEVDAVSFTKGCFVGQELVCRIDARGHVNRFLRHLVPDDDTVVLPVGGEITVGSKVVGTITSSAPGVALGYVRREVEPPAPATVDGAPLTVRAIPGTDD